MLFILGYLTIYTHLNSKTMNKFKSTFRIFAILFAVVTFTTACTKDDDDNTPMVPEMQNIVEIAASNPDFSILVAAIQKANLAGVLSGDGPFTVFAPTNQAFNAAGITSLDGLSAEALTPILLNHVISGKIMSTDLAAGDNYASSENATGPGNTKISLYINTSNGVVINNDAKVTTANIEASNGVIHVIDKVISADVDVVDIALQNSNFSSLVAALQAADGNLVSALQGDGPFTVFAPTNDAFAAIASVAATLTPAELANILTYHVVSGNVTASMLSDKMSVTALNADTFSIDLSSSTPKIMDASGNSVSIILTNVQGKNGVVHVINAVLLP
jgi:transforming growth factor-beta-induced protein